MKKTISFILSIVMVLSVLSICGGISAFAEGEDAYATTVLDWQGDYRLYVPSFNDDGSEGHYVLTLNATKSFGQKFSVKEGLYFTELYLHLLTVNNNDLTDGVFNVYSWKGDYATTTAAEPLYTTTFDDHPQDSSRRITIDAEKAIENGLTGDLYWEITATETDAEEGKYFKPFNAPDGKDVDLGISFINGEVSNQEIFGMVTVYNPDIYATKQITDTGIVYICPRNNEDTGYIDNGWAGNLDGKGKLTSLGIKVDVSDCHTVKTVKIDQINKANEGGTGASNYTLNVYAWDTDVATSKAKSPIYTAEYNLLVNDGSVTFDIPSDKILTGSLYCEISATNGTFSTVKTLSAANAYYKWFMNGILEKDGTKGAKGFIEIAEYTPEITNAQISLGTDISFNVYANGGANVEFTMNDNVTTVPVVDGKATLTGITPQCINDTIAINLLDSTGNVLDSDETTVDAILAKSVEADASCTDVVTALREYAKAAKVYRNYKADGVTVNATDVTVPAATATSTVEGLVGAGVRFDYNNKVYFILDSDTDVTINGEAVKGEAYNGNYIYYSEGINATEFAEIVTLKVGDATATYSVNAFAYRMQSNDTEAVANLAKTLYAYGAAAAEYAK